MVPSHILTYSSWEYRRRGVPFRDTIKKIAEFRDVQLVVEGGGSPHEGL